MSYSDQRKSFSPASIGTVVAVHVAIGYALVSGLAYQVVNLGSPITLVQQIPDDQAPPPPLPPLPREQRSASQPVAPHTIIDVPLNDPGTIAISDLPAPRAIPTDLPPILAQSQPKATQSVARGALPVGDKGAWVTTDDYPAAALRAETEGTVGIDVTIDANGRVSGCSVIASSGSELLDQTTCRVYAHRARFRPAQDENGQATVSHRTDRVRWEIPR